VNTQSAASCTKLCRDVGARTTPLRTARSSIAPVALLCSVYHKAHHLASLAYGLRLPPPSPRHATSSPAALSRKRACGALTSAYTAVQCTTLPKQLAVHKVHTTVANQYLAHQRTTHAQPSQPLPYTPHHHPTPSCPDSTACSLTTSPPHSPHHCRQLLRRVHQGQRRQGAAIADGRRGGCGPVRR
jgi:hypothetical protein